MLNTYVINLDNSAAIRSVSRSNDRLANIIRETSENEIKSKDRVDITLAEYEQMKNTIRYLESENQRLFNVLKAIDFPLAEFLNDERNVLENVVTEYCNDIINFKRKYCIQFDVSDWDRQRMGLY